MNAMKIALIYGGRSVEHEVSISSASSIYRHLLSLGCSVVPVWISKQGKWYVQLPDDQSKELPALACDEFEICVKFNNGLSYIQTGDKIEIDVCIPIVHGSQGEDGVLQGVLESGGLPYTGCAVYSSAAGMQKHYAKMIASYHGIPTTKWLTIDFSLYRSLKQHNELLNAFCLHDLRDFGESIVAKPVDGGSSVGVHVIKKLPYSDLIGAIEDVLDYSHLCMVEPFIDNMVEIECALFEKEGTLHASVCGMVHDNVTTDNKFLSYDRKYDAKCCASMVIPAPIAESQTALIQEYALRLGHAMGVQGFARVDFFYRPHTQEIFFNEINTLPGMTEHSHFPKLMQHSGYDWPSMLSLILDSAINRYAHVHSLRIERR